MKRYRCTDCGFDVLSYHDGTRLRLARHDRHGTPTWQWRRACIGSETSAEYVDLGRIEIKKDKA